MLHADRAVVVVGAGSVARIRAPVGTGAGEQARGAHRADDAGAGQVQGGERVEVHIGAPHGGGQRGVPEPAPLRFRRAREVDYGVEPAGEGGVDVLPQVGREHDQARVLLEPLEQVAHLGVRVAVGTVPHLAALAEERVRLVEEEHCAGAVHGGEDLLEPL